MFFFANHAPLLTDRFEFHNPDPEDPVMSNSFIYLLKSEANPSLAAMDEYLKRPDNQMIMPMVTDLLEVN